MLPRHENELFSRLEDVVEIGASQVRHSELLKYYDLTRFTTTIWRDIQSKWREVLRDNEYKTTDIEKYPLWIAYSDNTNSYILIWGANLELTNKDPKNKDTFFYPLEKWIEWQDEEKGKRKIRAV